LEGGAWVSEPAPRGLAIGELQASPSVKMAFLDARTITMRRQPGSIRKIESLPNQSKCLRFKGKTRRR
jgi:hypothetical protein